MSDPIKIEISVGELIDKLTILEIKRERIDALDKLANVVSEYSALNAAYVDRVVSTSALLALRSDLKAINARLWDIEDEIRECDRRGEFGADFIDLARSVYRTNDLRASLKRQINDISGSRLIEEESYQPY
jgi:hypothetical protein